MDRGRETSEAGTNFSVGAIRQAAVDAYNPDVHRALNQQGNCPGGPCEKIKDWHPSPGSDSPEARKWQEQNKELGKHKIEEKEYTVKPGDSLGTIAERTLKGEGNQHPSPADIDKKMKEIIEQNKEQYPTLVCNPDYIVPGMKLKVGEPPKPETNFEHDPNVTRGQGGEPNQPGETQNRGGQGDNGGTNGGEKSGEGGQCGPKKLEPQQTEHKAKDPDKHGWLDIPNIEDVFRYMTA
jgi:hypothetical protein